MALARLSAATERAWIGTSVLLLPLYPPAIVAKQVADLDRATADASSSASGSAASTRRSSGHAACPSGKGGDGPTRRSCF